MRDIREKNWFWLDNALVDREDIGAMEKLIYMMLARFADQNGKCFPSQEKLCRISGVKDYRTIVKYIEALEKKGLVEVKKRRGKLNIYHLKNVDKEERQEDEEKLNVPHNEVPASNVGTKNEGANEVPASNVGRVPASNVGQTKHKEQNTINNTQLKEKNKKEKSKTEIKLFINSLEKTDEYKKLLFEFLEYRKKIKDTVKTTGPIKLLLKHFVDEEACERRGKELLQELKKYQIDNYHKLSEEEWNDLNDYFVDYQVRPENDFEKILDDYVDEVVRKYDFLYKVNKEDK